VIDQALAFVTILAKLQEGGPNLSRGGQKGRIDQLPGRRQKPGRKNDGHGSHGNQGVKETAMRSFLGFGRFILKIRVSCLAHASPHSHKWLKKGHICLVKKIFGRYNLIQS
jgi:hypothetical protein